MTRHELAQAAAEYCASPGSDEKLAALIDAVGTLPHDDPAFKYPSHTIKFMRSHPPLSATLDCRVSESLSGRKV